VLEIIKKISKIVIIALYKTKFILTIVNTAQRRKQLDTARARVDNSSKRKLG
jgi:hypothetical protein